MPDPKLITACQEIQAILDKHDIAGIVHVASTTHTHYLYVLSPSWSAARLEENELRVRAKVTEFPSVENQQKCLRDTVGMIAGFADSSYHTVEQLHDVLAALGQHMQIYHRSRHEQ